MNIQTSSTYWVILKPIEPNTKESERLIDITIDIDDALDALGYPDAKTFAKTLGHHESQMCAEKSGKVFTSIMGKVFVSISVECSTAIPLEFIRAVFASNIPKEMLA